MRSDQGLAARSRVHMRLGKRSSLKEKRRQGRRSGERGAFKDGGEHPWEGSPKRWRRNRWPRSTSAVGCGRGGTTAAAIWLDLETARKTPLRPAAPNHLHLSNEGPARRRTALQFYALNYSSRNNTLTNANPDRDAESDGGPPLGLQLRRLVAGKSGLRVLGAGFPAGGWRHARADSGGSKFRPTRRKSCRAADPQRWKRAQQRARVQAGARSWLYPSGKNLSAEAELH